MTRKRNATPCPRCKLIRQEWRRGRYHVQIVSGDGLREMCWRCHDEIRVAMNREDFFAFDVSARSGE